MLVFFFLKKLLKKWYVYLSLIPIVQGFSVSYFEAEVYFKQNFLWGFALVSVFFACYSVWLEQKKEYDKLQSALIVYKNKFSSFEVTAVPKKIYIEDDFSSSLIQRKRKQVKEKLEKLESEISDLSSSNNRALSSSVRLSQFYNVHGRTNGDDVRLSKEQLIQYRDALNSYLESSSQYEKALQSLMSEQVENCYLIDFYIKNTSQVFDENIDLSICISNENSFLNADYLTNILPSYLDIPKREAFQDYKKDVLTPIHSDYLRVDRINELLNYQNASGFYKYYKLDEHEFSLNIKELKAEESVRVTRKSFVTKLNNIDSLQYTILSNHSGQKFSGAVVVDIDSSGIKYKEVLMNTEVNFLERD